MILTDHAVLPEHAERAEAESILEDIVATEGSSDTILDDERIKLAIERGYAEALIKVMVAFKTPVSAASSSCLFSSVDILRLVESRSRKPAGRISFGCNYRVLVVRGWL